MLDFAIFAKGRADETDRITAVALNFEMKGKRCAFNGYQISILTSYNQEHNIKCMATNEMKNGCGSSIEAVLASNQRRRVKKTENYVSVFSGEVHWASVRSASSTLVTFRSLGVPHIYLPKFIFSKCRRYPEAGTSAAPIDRQITADI